MFVRCPIHKLARLTKSTLLAVLGWLSTLNPKE
jgi:hypothetical protein